MSVSKPNVDEVTKRMKESPYLVEPLTRHFAAVVRITVMSLKFVRNVRRNIVRRKDLNIVIQSAKFTMFFSFTEFLVKQKVQPAKKREEFLTKWRLKTDKEVLLTEVDLSIALENIFKNATTELKKFNNKRMLENVGTEIDGILYSKNRIMEGYDLQVMGELEGYVNLGPFASVRFKTPLVDEHSTLAVTLAYHLHWLLNHRGTDTVYRLSLEYAQILKGKHIYRRIGHECTKCNKRRGKYMGQIMGLLHSSQLAITPVFFYTQIG